MTSEPAADIVDAEGIHSEAMDGNELGVCVNLELHHNSENFRLCQFHAESKNSAARWCLAYFYVFKK